MKGFFKVPNAIFKCGLDKHELPVYCFLAMCSNQGAKAYPSYNTIADTCGIARSTTIEAVDSLVNRGLVVKVLRKIEPDADRRSNDSNVYTVNRDIDIEKVLLQRYDKQIKGLYDLQMRKRARLLIKAIKGIDPFPPDMEEKTLRVVALTQAGDMDVMWYINPYPHLRKKRPSMGHSSTVKVALRDQRLPSAAVIPQFNDGHAVWYGTGNVDELLSPLGG